MDDTAKRDDADDDLAQEYRQHKLANYPTDQQNKFIRQESEALEGGQVVFIIIIIIIII